MKTIKLLLTTLLLTLSFSAMSQDWIQLPNPDIDVRGYIIKDTQILLGSEQKELEYSLPSLEGTWVEYRVCVTSRPAFIDWDNNIFYPLVELPKVKFISSIAGVNSLLKIKTVEQTCSELIPLDASASEVNTFKLKLTNLKDTDVVNKIAIKVFSNTINLK
jgi:hypothetical protein